MAECLVHRLRSSSLKDAIITPGSSSVTVYGGTGSNTVSFTYTGDGTVSASSSNTEVATVAVSGNNITVTYVAAGSATITISAPKTSKYKECSATVSVICSRSSATITPSATSLSIAGATGSGSVTYTYNGNGTVSASSNDTNVATVSVSGTTVTVTYKAAGSATITISAAQTNTYASCSATVAVTCERSTPTLSLSATSGTIYGGGSSGAYTYSYNGDGAVSASSSNTGVATVALSGNNISVSYVAPGSATVTVSAPQTAKYNAVSATIAITCSRTALTKPSLTQTSYTVNAGTTCTPGYNNYNSNLMTVSGTTSASSGGSYAIYFNLKDTNRYCWSDGTTGQVGCGWSITIKTVTFYVVRYANENINRGYCVKGTCNAGNTFNNIVGWYPRYINGSYSRNTYLTISGPWPCLARDSALNSTKYPLHYDSGKTSYVGKNDIVQERTYYADDIP